MSTSITINDNKIDLLVKAGVIPANVPLPILDIFGQVCQRHGLDPVKKEIFLVPYNVETEKGWEQRFANIVGRDGLRIKAQRTGELAGISAPTYDKKLTEYLKGETPLYCSITVKRLVKGIVCEFTSTVLFTEFSSGKRKWLSMPFHMIAKVAESHALKMGFGEETNGLNAEEELAAFEDQTENKVIQDNTINEELSKISTIDELKRYYRQIDKAGHITPEVCQLFTERKNEINEQGRTN